MTTGTQRRNTTVVALTTLGFLVLLWAAGTGSPLLSRPQSTLNLPQAEGTAAPPTTTPTRAAEQQPPSDSSINLHIDWLVVLFVCALLVVIGLAVRWLLSREDDREPRIDAEDALDTLVEATAAGPAGVRAQGDPRNAVVACWVALEDGVSRAGLEPSPAETSVDLATRVLARWRVDPVAVTALADLYREARFSRHPVTEQQRDEAVAILDRINADLRAAARDREDAQ